MLTIGFATEYYTLWEVKTETQYFTDSYGKHWPLRNITNFIYIKNISTDLSKVEAQYPNVLIDENLKGQTRSFSTSNANEDLSPEILKFGKYCGRLITDIVKEDFKYILWLLDAGKTVLIDELKKLPEVISYFEKIEQAKNDKINSFQIVTSGIQTITFVCNPNDKIKNSYGCGEDDLNEYKDYYFAQVNIQDDHKLFILFNSNDIVPVNGMYPYNMALINGKAKRIKNKTFTLNLSIICTSKNEYGCHQFAIIK